MECKYNNLTTEQALNRGWCKTCNTYECIKIKDKNIHCHKCNNTGITDCNNNEVTICNNCIWGLEFALEQQEYQSVDINELEQLFLQEG